MEVDLDFESSLTINMPPVNQYKELSSVRVNNSSKNKMLRNEEKNNSENLQIRLSKKSTIRSIRTIRGKSKLYSHNFKNESPDEKKLWKKPINILYMIKCVSVAIKKLRNRTIFKSIKYLLNEEFNLIDDKTYFCENKEKMDDKIKLLLSKGFLKKMLYRFKIFFKKIKVFNFFINLIRNFYFNISKIPVISPETKIKIIWDFLMIIIDIIFFFIFPLQISFNIIFVNYFFGSSNYDFLRNWIVIGILGIFLIDLLLKFFTGFYKDGILVLEMKSAIKNYIYSIFFYDLISLIPIILNVISIVYSEKMELYNDLIKFSGLLFFFKFFDVSKLIKSFEEIIHFTEKGEAFFKLFKLLSSLIFIIHLLACLWNAVAYYSPYDKTILKFDENKSNNPKIWYNDYLSCIYWSISYGKVNPQNSLEHAFGAFAVFVYQIASAFIIGGILNILKILSHKENEKKENMRAINDYMREKNIEYDLQVKVRKYLNFIFDKTDNTEKGKEIINKLSNSLKEEVLIRANGTIIKNIPLFSKNFSEESLRKTVFLMKNIKFYPEEVIYEKEGSDRFLYLICDGEIDICMDSINKRHNIKKLKKGDIFGEYSFFTNNNRLCSAISSTFTTVFAISRADFISIIKENPLDYEKFSMIKDKIFLDKYDDEISLKCYSCINKDHSIFVCPSLHYIPDSKFIISKHLFSKPHFERVSFKRKRKRSKKTLFNKKELKNLQFNNLTANESENDMESDENECTYSENSIDKEKKIDIELNLIESKEKIELNKDQQSFLKKDSFSTNDNINKEICISNSNKILKINNFRENNENKNSIETIFHDSNINNNIFDKEVSLNKKTNINNEIHYDISNKINSNDVQNNTILICEKNNDLFLKEFDSMKNYQAYFPQNNAAKIIKDQEIKFSKLRRKSTKSKSWKKNVCLNQGEFSNLGLVFKIMKNDKNIENSKETINSPLTTYLRKKRDFFAG